MFGCRGFADASGRNIASASPNRLVQSLRLFQTTCRCRRRLRSGTPGRRGEHETGANRKSAEEKAGRGGRLAEKGSDVQIDYSQGCSEDRKRGWQNLPPSS